MRYPILTTSTRKKFDLKKYSKQSKKEDLQSQISSGTRLRYLRNANIWFRKMNSEGIFGWIPLTSQKWIAGRVTHTLECSVGSSQASPSSLNLQRDELDSFPLEGLVRTYLTPGAKWGQGSQNPFLRTLHGSGQGWKGSQSPRDLSGNSKMEETELEEGDIRMSLIPQKGIEIPSSLNLPVIIKLQAGSSLYFIAVKNWMALKNS